MHFIHRIIDWIFERHPLIKEFCFLTLPLSSTPNGCDGLFNATEWNKYLDAHAKPLARLQPLLDNESVKRIQMLINRRRANRYFLTFSEILRYYKAKRLALPYWFPPNSTLLKSVFLCRAGTLYVPTNKQGILKGRFAIDGGAASGDSSIALVEAGVRHVLAFEPSPYQQKEMAEVFQRNNLSKFIDIVPFALSDKRQKLLFADQYAKKITAESISIDEYCQDKDIGCIKLDIEGAEFPAIRGAMKTIARCRPILLICAYHRPQDLFEMPLWIHQHFPFYKFCLHDTEPGNRAVGVHLTLIAYPS